MKRRERLCFDWITHEVTKRAKYYHNEIGYAHTQYIKLHKTFFSTGKYGIILAHTNTQIKIGAFRIRYFKSPKFERTDIKQLKRGKCKMIRSKLREMFLYNKCHPLLFSFACALSLQLSTNSLDPSFVRSVESYQRTW